MPRAKLIELPRPEGGAERHVTWIDRHNCSQGRSLRGEVDEDVDSLLFPVGVMGWEMPIGVAFEVTSAHPCPACGAWLKMWFQWKGPRLWTP